MQILVFNLIISFCFINTIGQEKSKSIDVKGTVKIETLKGIPTKIRVKKLIHLKKLKNEQNINTNIKDLVEPYNSFEEKNELKIIKGVVIRFTNDKGIIYTTKTNEKGRFQINLPIGKYNVYATASEGCWMCAEYYNKGFIIENRHKIKLNIILQFFGEG